MPAFALGGNSLPAPQKSKMASTADGFLLSAYTDCNDNELLRRMRAGDEESKETPFAFASGREKPMAASHAFDSVCRQHLRREI